VTITEQPADAGEQPSGKRQRDDGGGGSLLGFVGYAGIVATILLIIASARKGCWESA